jgi:hypothetical protein
LQYLPIAAPQDGRRAAGPISSLDAYQCDGDEIEFVFMRTFPGFAT